MSNLCIAQSGGPTAAINASLAGVLREFLKDESYNKIFGLRFGITGIFTNEYVALILLKSLIKHIALEKCMR